MGKTYSDRTQNNDGDEFLAEYRFDYQKAKPNRFAACGEIQPFTTRNDIKPMNQASEMDDNLRPEYDFTQLKVVARGQGRFRQFLGWYYRLSRILRRIGHLG